MFEFVFAAPQARFIDDGGMPLEKKISLAAPAPESSAKPEVQEPSSPTAIVPKASMKTTAVSAREEYRSRPKEHPNRFQSGETRRQAEGREIQGQ